MTADAISRQRSAKRKEASNTDSFDDEHDAIGAAEVTSALRLSLQRHLYEYFLVPRRLTALFRRPKKPRPDEAP